MHRYRAFGLSIESDLQLPELVRGDGAATDLRVMRSELPAPLEDDFDSRVSIWGERDFLQFEVPGVGRFRAVSGKALLYDPEGDADPSDLRLFALGSGFGAVLMQRSSLVLHGSVVVADSRAFAFLGDSGAGKSTLAASLVARGLGLLSDDLCVVSCGKELMVQPGYPQGKLWRDSLEALRLDRRELTRVRSGLDKRALPYPRAEFSSEATALARVYVLGSDRLSLPRVTALQGADAIIQMLGCGYRPAFVEAMDLESTRFLQLDKVARRAGVSVLQRPASIASLEATVDLVHKDILRLLRN